MVTRNVRYRPRIESLAGHPSLVATVAGWHWSEWGHVDPGGSLESWTEGLHARTNRNRIPATYVAFVGDEPVGSVVLVDHDMPDREDLAHLRPWLAGLFVPSEFRGLGVGSALIRHAEAEAARFGVTRLYLYTGIAAPLYQRLGWTELSTTTYEGQPVSILTKDVSKATRSDAPRAIIEG